MNYAFYFILAWLEENLIKYVNRPGLSWTLIEFEISSFQLALSLFIFVFTDKATSKGIVKLWKKEKFSYKNLFFFILGIFTLVETPNFLLPVAYLRAVNLVLEILMLEPENESPFINKAGVKTDIVWKPSTTSITQTVNPVFLKYVQKKLDIEQERQ